MLAALLGGFLVAGLLYAAAPAAAAGYPSNDCDTSQTIVFDGFLVSNYIKLRASSGPGGETWVCFAVDDQARHFGGKAIVSRGSGTPLTMDDDWDACNLNPGQIAGDSGTIIGRPFEYEIEQTPTGDVQICVMLDGGTVGKRFKISPAGIPSANFLPDDAQPYPYTDAISPGNASGTCQTNPARKRWVNAQIGLQRIWLVTLPESQSRNHVCWRVSSPLLQPSGFPYGGRITVDSGGQQTFVTAGATSDLSACDQDIITTQSGFLLRYHVGVIGPSYVCARIPSVISWRLEANPSGQLGVVSVAGDTS